MSIESNIPIPPRRGQPRWTPLLRKMKYYDSFLVCCYLRPGEDEKKMAHHIEIAAYRLGFRVAIRTTKDGIRVWKIDNKEGRA